MMDFYVVEKLAAHHRSALVSEAEARRVLKEAYEASGRVTTTYDRALAQIGHWLVERGKRLEERHGEPTRSTAPSRKGLTQQPPVSLSHSHNMTVERGLWGL